MGDFLQFNPDRLNSLTDAEYLASTYRTGGLVTGQAKANAHNKLFYQISTMAKAIADMMEAKGFTVSDASLSVLAEVLGNLISTADMKSVLHRPVFSWVDSNTITIGRGSYHHKGTTNQIVKWESSLTLDVSVSGSRWYHLYIDDSAVVSAGTNILTASEILCSTTSPTWSDTKNGLYNGDDLWIFSIYVKSGILVKFVHDGGDYVYLDPTSITAFLGTVSTTPTTVNMALPLHVRKCAFKCFFWGSSNGAQEVVISSDTAYRDIILYLHSYQSGHSGTGGGTHREVFMDSSGQLKVWSSLYSTTGGIYVAGWYFPYGS